MAVNEAKLRAFLSRVLYDLAAAQSAPLVVIGDRLGLYRAMAGSGPLAPQDLARRTGLDESYVTEWLVNQASAGYLSYDGARGTFELSEEAAYALADEASPHFIPPAFQIATGLAPATAHVARAFGGGEAVPATAYGPELLEGMDRASRVRARAALVPSWLPALEVGMTSRLESGASVADVGCGRGGTLIVLAGAYVRSRFVGFDQDLASIEYARTAAAAAGVSDGVRFEVASATSFPGGDYDLVTCLDSLHEMARPVEAARRIREALRPGGTWLVVEPFTRDRIEETLDVFGRLSSSVSALHCLAAARAGGGGRSGTVRGEKWVREVALAAGFGDVRRLPDSPFELVYAVRP